MIPGLAFGEQQHDRAFLAGADGVEFRLPPALGAPSPPLVRPRQRSGPPFAEAGRGAVRFAVRGIDHPALGRAALVGKGCEDAVEHTHAAYRPAGVAFGSAEEAIVEGLWGP
jgi:hypothetical protein